MELARTLEDEEKEKGEEEIGFEFGEDNQIKVADSTDSATR